MKKYTKNALNIRKNENFGNRISFYFKLVQSSLGPKFHEAMTFDDWEFWTKIIVIPFICRPIWTTNRKLFPNCVFFKKNNYYILTGDFAGAIETLVTAISLIKQSKIAGDDRCKILISSLQDTLHGIEEKSYGGG